MRKPKRQIVTATFTYTGKEQDFGRFLQAVIHDYLLADHPCSSGGTDIIENVESQKTA